MPPFNAQRRDRLADSGIELLAREGARGLTHRGVDAQAGEPPGTTSRYFRTREALMTAVVDRVRELHFADLAAAPRGPVDPRAIGDHLAGMVRAAVTVNRSRQMAILELFLESTRRPGLRAAMTETRLSQIQIMREIHRAAGIELTDRQAATLVTAMTGLVHTALTTPEAVGVDSPEGLRNMVHALTDLSRAPSSAR